MDPLVIIEAVRSQLNGCLWGGHLPHISCPMPSISSVRRLNFALSRQILKTLKKKNPLNSNKVARLKSNLVCLDWNKTHSMSCDNQTRYTLLSVCHVLSLYWLVSFSLSRALLALHWTLGWPPWTASKGTPCPLTSIWTDH